MLHILESALLICEILPAFAAASIEQSPRVTKPRIFEHFACPCLESPKICNFSRDDVVFQDIKI